MKCKRCQDAGELFMPGKIIKCPDCQAITNDEYIRNCSIKERAKLLYRIGFLSDITGNVVHNAIMQNIPTEKAFELWLNQPHTAKQLRSNCEVGYKASGFTGETDEDA